MKQILIYISLFLIGICTINAQSVTANQMNGRLQMTTVSNVSDSTWSITGYFTNSVNKYLPSNINVNDKFFCQIGANTYVGRISVINSRSDVTKLITFRVICNYPNPPNNIGAIIRATSNGYPVFVDGLPNALQAGIQNYFATLINTNAAGNPCEKTITKTSHGFRKGTPVKRVGGTYVRPTNDTIVPDFIVVDSLTANTFKVSTCGLYPSVLPDGLYWFTSASPGYSLIADTVKVPLFQVLNDTMILNPIVGFNLMSGSGSGDVTSSVLADTAAAIRADFPNGIISALPNDSVGITSMHPLRISNPNGFVQIKDGKFIANWKSDNVIISAYNNRPIIDDGAAVSVGCCEDSIMYGGVLVGMYSSLKKGGVGYFSTVVGYNSEADSTIKYTLVGTKNRVFGVRSDAALLGNYINSYGSYVFGVGQSLRFNHNFSGLFGYGMATDKINQFKYGIQTRQVQHDFLGNLAIFDSTRTAASFVHDSRKDTTLIHGTAVFGKPSSLGSPTSTGYSFIFRDPSNSSTGVLIESGRTSPTGGSASIHLLPSGIWNSVFLYGSNTSKGLSFYSGALGRNVLTMGSSGFVSGSSRTIIIGEIDDPTQWNGNASLVVYDTITSGKALFLAKKITTSSTPIAMFSSGANDRMTIEDDGDVKIGTGAASAKLHVIGDCIIESTLWLNAAKTVGIFSGTGTPEGVVTASVGSTFHRTNGGALTSYYVKESGTGNTGWVAK